MKRALLTGATGGIGKALCLELACQGYSIIAWDLDRQALASLQKEIAAVAATYALDLTDTQDLASACRQVQVEHGPVDVVINNAGIAHLQEFQKEGPERFMQVMKVNFEAAVHMAHFWLPHLEERGGCLVNIASVAGHVPAPRMASYCASKFALVGFTRSLQAELKARNSKAWSLLVSPGFIRTSIMRIGQKEGLPKELEFLTATPASCAREIAQALKARKEFITPGLSGKLMMGLARLAPSSLDFMARALAHRMR